MVGVLWFLIFDTFDTVCWISDAHAASSYLPSSPAAFPLNPALSSINQGLIIYLINIPYQMFSCFFCLHSFNHISEEDKFYQQHPVDYAQFIKPNTIKSKGDTLDSETILLFFLTHLNPI